MALTHSQAASLQQSSRLGLQSHPPHHFDSRRSKNFDKHFCHRSVTRKAVRPKWHPFRLCVRGMIEGALEFLHDLVGVVVQAEQIYPAFGFFPFGNDERIRRDDFELVFITMISSGRRLRLLVPGVFDHRQ